RSAPLRVSELPRFVRAAPLFARSAVRREPRADVGARWSCCARPPHQRMARFRLACWRRMRAARRSQSWGHFRRRRSAAPVLCGRLVALLKRCPSMRNSREMKPNFVVILIDDLRYDEFGAGGHPYMKTPHVDRIANEGALFERAF